MAYNGLPAFVDMNVFNGDFLLAFAAVTVEGVKQHGVGAGQLVRLRQVLAPPL
ncbi:MAG: hypothetical protein ACXU9C_04355 [Xanthobacteraceae bacterium]